MAKSEEQALISPPARTDSSFDCEQCNVSEVQGAQIVSGLICTSFQVLGMHVKSSLHIRKASALNLLTKHKRIAAAAPHAEGTLLYLNL